MVLFGCAPTTLHEFSLSSLILFPLVIIVHASDQSLVQQLTTLLKKKPSPKGKIH